MPIEVHCPNPQCAKVHLVKDKYAGMRGKCPACASWMYIPRSTPPAVAELEPEVVVEEGKQPVSVVVRREPVARTVNAKTDVDAADKPVEVTPDAEKPAKKFSCVAALLLVVGMLSFGAIAATPYLDVGSANATGYFTVEYGQRKFETIREDQKWYVTVVPAGGAALVFLALLAGIVAGRFGFLSLFLVYASTLLAAALLFLALAVFHEQGDEVAKLRARVEGLKQKGKQGDIDPSLGQYLWVGLGGAIGASASLILAAIAMHRRWWSRVLAFLFLGGVTALGVVWIYRKELNIEGIDQYIPWLT